MTNPTAAIIIIGNEILSGRTLDLNTQEIALRLDETGISLLETRTIPDNKNMIIDAIRHLSAAYDYVFTTGGIGPTHDDITAESVAAAFNVKCVVNQDAYNRLKDYSIKVGEPLNPAREKMAYMPESATLLYPGFVIKNVFVMAGIPEVTKTMLKAAIPMLKKGKIVKTKTLEVMTSESRIASQFENLQNKYKGVEMGSYPFTKDGIHGTALVLRSADYEALEAAFKDLKEIVSPA
ncbi:MAG: molybdopterin-binding protein [Rickettsiaceae bacterium]